MRVHRWHNKEGSRGVRAFLHVYRNADSGPTLLEARCEAYAFSGAKHTGIALEFDDDSAGIQLFVGIAHVGDVWLTAGSPEIATRIYRRWKKGTPALNIVSLRLHDRAIWWEVWHDKWGWKSGTPKWRYGNFQWWDWITGKPVYRSELTEGPVRVDIPMPEGTYPATVTLSRDTWTRARWPWPQVRNGYNIEMLSREDGKPGYVPVPGKGENSWDCGPDGIFGQSGSARTIEEAIGQLVAGALRDRKRYDGRHDYAEKIS